MLYITDITDYFKSLYPECENFYTFIRDDNKAKSLTIYKIEGIGNKDQLGGNIHKVMGLQLQLVYGKSIKESEAKIREIVQDIADGKTQVHTIDGKEFYLLNKNHDEHFFYFGTNPGGYQKYAIDLIIYYNE